MHADRLVDEADRDALERLCRYGARSPVANSRLSLDPSGRVVLSFKPPLHDGRAELPDGDVSRAILEHLGLPTEPPLLGAGGPPRRRRDDTFT